MRERKTKDQLENAQGIKKEGLDLGVKRIERDAQCLRRTFESEDGRRALSLIMAKMCYQSPVTTQTKDGTLRTENLQHNAALQGMYLWLRKFMSKETLMAVEVIGIEETLKGSNDV